MADVRVAIDLVGIEKKVSPQAVAKGRLAVANQALMIMEPYVPSRSGDLRASGHVESNGDVSYNTVYARAHLYGTNGIVTFRKYTTPGTGKRWDKPLVANVDKLKQVAIRAMGIR